MAMDGLPEGVSPFGRVPEQLLQAAPILKRRGGGTERVSRKRVSVQGFLIRGVNIGEGRSRGATQGSQEAPWRGPGGAPGTLVGPWWWPSCSLLTFPEGSVTLIFNIIVPEFFGHFK